MAEMRWFRMWTDAVDNPKLRLLAFEDRWHFVALCCLKRTGLLDRPDDGTRERMIAVKLGVQCRELDEIRRRLVEVGLIDTDLHPIGWDDRQYVSDSSTERVRRHRSMKRKGNVTETPPDTDTDTEEEEEKISRAKGARVPSRHIDLVFQHWQTEHEHPNAKCSEKRRRLIASRLKTYSLDDLRKCLTGYKRSPFHRGDNPTGQKYDSIELMLRDEKHVEQGLQFFADPPKGIGNGQGKPPASTRHRDATERLRQWAESGDP